MLDLTGKVAIVTGGARGLGLSISRALAMAGAQVAVVYPPFESKPEETIDELRSFGTKIMAYEADVTLMGSVESMVSSVLGDYGKIDILVNNAGKMSETLLAEMSLDEWDDIIATDLRSVFICSKAVISHMIEQKQGTIINISSQIAYKGGARLSHYAAAKAGVIAFTKSLAQEVAVHGIRVNAVAPGPIVTDMTRSFMNDPSWLVNKERAALLGRLGSPDEVAPSVVFLASPLSSLYLGQTLLPNGGGVML